MFSSELLLEAFSLEFWHEKMHHGMMSDVWAGSVLNISARNHRRRCERRPTSGRQLKATCIFHLL